MTRPRRSTRITRSQLPRGGPPLRHASLLKPSRFQPLGPLALADSEHHPHFAVRGITAQVPTFHTEAQAKLAPPPCRTPPGQSAGSRQAPHEPELQARFRCRLPVSTRPQWFTLARLLDPYLTHSQARRFPQRTTPALYRRSLRWFAASPYKATTEDHQPKQPDPSIFDAAPHQRNRSSTSHLLSAFVAHECPRIRGTQYL
jgi:hypothetical protein